MQEHNSAYLGTTQKEWANLLRVNVRFETSDVVDDATRDALELACV